MKVESGGSWDSTERLEKLGKELGKETSVNKVSDYRIKGGWGKVMKKDRGSVGCLGGGWWRNDVIRRKIRRKYGWRLKIQD